MPLDPDEVIVGGHSAASGPLPGSARPAHLAKGLGVDPGANDRRVTVARLVAR